MNLKLRKIQEKEDCTPNVNLKLGIDNAPKKRVLQLWKCKPFEVNNPENQKEGKMMVKLSNAESTEMTVGNVHDSKDMTDHSRKMDVGDPVAMGSSLTETVTLINEATRSTISANHEDTIEKNDTIPNLQDGVSNSAIEDVGLRLNDNYSDTVIKNNQYQVVNTTNTQSHISTSMLTANTNEDSNSMVDRNWHLGSQQLSTSNSSSHRQVSNWNNSAVGHLGANTK